MTFTRLGLTAALVLALLPAGASAQEPPPNDHYLNSVRVNQPGTKLPVRTTLRATGDTTAATTQPDLFAPPQSGGPAEPTQCPQDNGQVSTYGNTVWYDFFPHANGVVRATVNGNFDPVIGILQFDPQSSRPIFPGTCIDRLSFTNEVLEFAVRRGRSYTVQVGAFQGGQSPPGGAYEFLFDFIPVSPRPLSADTSLRARATPNGIRITGLSVEAPRGARVEVRCSRGCRRQTKRASNPLAGYSSLRPVGFSRGSAHSSAAKKAARPEPVARSARTVSFRRLNGVAINAGQRIEIRITKPNTIGRYFKYAIGRGSFKKTRACLNPGSTRPRRRCTG